MFFEEPTQKDRSSDKWEVSGRAARSNRIAGVGQWADGQKAWFPFIPYHQLILALGANLVNCRNLPVFAWPILAIVPHCLLRRSCGAHN